MIVAAWLALPSWAKYLIAALAAVGMIYAYAATIKHEAYHEGASDERAKHHERALDNVEKSKKAAEAVTTNPAVRDALCLRNARNPQDC